MKKGKRAYVECDDVTEVGEGHDTVFVVRMGMGERGRTHAKYKAPGKNQHILDEGGRMRTVPQYQSVDGQVSVAPYTPPRRVRFKHSEPEYHRVEHEERFPRRG